MKFTNNPKFGSSTCFTGKFDREAFRGYAAAGIDCVELSTNYNNYFNTWEFVDRPEEQRRIYQRGRKARKHGSGRAAARKTRQGDERPYRRGGGHRQQWRARRERSRNGKQIKRRERCSDETENERYPKRVAKRVRCGVKTYGSDR